MKTNRYRGWSIAIIVVAMVVVVVAAGPAHAQLQWVSKDGKTNFKVGLLGQVQAESIDSAGNTDKAQNLFLRRARILMNFDLGDNLAVFLESDSPNLGKSDNTGTKNSGDMYIQDFVVSYKFHPSFALEAGMILPATSYNHTQSAATLLAVDYGAYTFTEGSALGARVGRDYGVQARGYLANNRLEYRAGVFQGARGTNAANDFRYYGRVMYQFFTPQTGLFYRGTSFGKTKTLSFGASFDAQKNYRTYSGDVFFDLPVGNGNGLTLKGEVTRFDGGSFLTAIPKQTDVLIEGGFFLGGSSLMPFVQYASQNFSSQAKVDEKRLGIGLGYIPRGHNHNLKLSWSQISPDRGDKRDQWLLQWQVFLF